MGMSMLTLGLAADEAANGVAGNCLWPRTLIATAAVQNLLGGEEAMRRARTPDLYADAAYRVLTSPSRKLTGRALLCEDVLVESGVADLSAYSAAGADAELQVDLFVDAVNPPMLG
jgi:citronellol/citronellal dehydrogenase